jgi:hypothetical protein
MTSCGTSPSCASRLRRTGRATQPLGRACRRGDLKGYGNAGSVERGRQGARGRGCRAGGAAGCSVSVEAARRPAPRSGHRASAAVSPCRGPRDEPGNAPGLGLSRWPSVRWPAFRQAGLSEAWRRPSPAHREAEPVTGACRCSSLHGRGIEGSRGCPLQGGAGSGHGTGFRGPGTGVSAAGGAHHTGLHRRASGGRTGTRSSLRTTRRRVDGVRTALRSRPAAAIVRRRFARHTARI